MAATGSPARFAVAGLDGVVYTVRADAEAAAAVTGQPPSAVRALPPAMPGGVAGPSAQSQLFRVDGLDGVAFTAYADAAAAAAAAGVPLDARQMRAAAQRRCG